MNTEKLATILAIVILYQEAKREASELRRQLQGADLRPAFRLSKTTVEALIQMLPPREKPHGWSHEIEVAVCLYWLACGSSYRVTADIFAIPRATVARIVHNVVEEMMIILHRTVHFPKLEDMEEVGAGFAQLAGHEAFRCVAGTINGCHIRAIQPAEPQKKSYINQELFTSVVLQDVSPMYKESLYPPPDYVLLGDGGYPCLRHSVTVITLYHQPLAGRVEECFNQHHARARNVVEQAFGMLKTRRGAIFLWALEIRPVFAPKVVTACCILHNLCLATGNILEEEHHEDDGGGVQENGTTENTTKHSGVNLHVNPIAIYSGAPSLGGAEDGEVTTPPVVEVRLAAATRGGRMECCPWSAASIILTTSRW
ncbi:putative nuclease HARBI1 [Xyrichtys novacula]|uniref:Nuclease HARBI1 n=1 Tax=Xyrichtys novacula TaxID=13765 RepID=A0AAV1EQH0_XYRNO|nr:putative nuclease HARBI1 [Xyrichtys novacula]